MLLVGLSVTIVIFLIILIAAQILVPTKKEDAFSDYDWSSSWTVLDWKARAGANCKPISTIHRKMGEISPWIWVVPDSCEQGLPHTRSIDVIAIPKSFPKERLESTLEHEKIHLYQRAMPESWAKFYRIKWKYDIYSKPPAGMPKELINMRRANPDTADAPWCCWMGKHWSVPVYQNEYNLSLSKAPVKWWNQLMNVITNNPPDDWVNFFGSDVNQSEHPHEISAEFLSGPLLKGTDEIANPSQAMNLLSYAWNEDEMIPSLYVI